jgi:uncharacterized protein YceK
MFKIIKIACLILSTLALLNGCATLQQRITDKEAALDVTKVWFKYLDERNYEKLWEISSDLLKLKTDKEDFIREIRGIREPLGNILDRNLQVNEVMPLIEHYPDGKYRRVVYWSKYERKDFVRENFILIKEGNRWGVLRYDFI